jgi:CRISPR-associated protein Cmr4
MYRKSNLLFLMSQTPMHAGSGDSLGIIDMPIQRERHTSFPKIEASSLKGSIREHFERAKGEKDKEILAASFGTEGENGKGSRAGALGFTDARLLLFPVKSMKGVFAWVTCPKIISVFNEELSLSGYEIQFDVQENTVATGNNLSLNSNKIVLEEYTFEVNDVTGAKNAVNELGAWLSSNLLDGKGYFADKLKTDIVVLKDDDFKDFVNLSTEVLTRTRIDNETGTVADGALFTEEYLPAEAIMYTNVLTAAEFATADDKKAAKQFDTEADLRKYFREFISQDNVFQIGGNATLGKGIVKAKFVEPNNGGN